MSDALKVRLKNPEAEAYIFRSGHLIPPEWTMPPHNAVWQWQPPQYPPLDPGGSVLGETFLQIEDPVSGNVVTVRQNQYLLRFPDGHFEARMPSDFDGPDATWEIVVEKEQADPFALQLTLSMGRFAVFQATYDSIVAALRDHGYENMADALDNAWFIAFGDALGTPKANAPEGGTQ